MQIRLSRPARRRPVSCSRAGCGRIATYSALRLSGGRRYCDDDTRCVAVASGLILAARAQRHRASKEEPVESVKMDDAQRTEIGEALGEIIASVDRAKELVRGVMTTAGSDVPSKLDVVAAIRDVTRPLLALRAALWCADSALDAAAWSALALADRLGVTPTTPDSDAELTAAEAAFDEVLRVAQLGLDPGSLASCDEGAVQHHPGA